MVVDAVNTACEPKVIVALDIVPATPPLDGQTKDP
jgi:hypothetical protein